MLLLAGLSSVCFRNGTTPFSTRQTGLVWTWDSREVSHNSLHLSQRQQGGGSRLRSRRLQVGARVWRNGGRSKTRTLDENEIKGMMVREADLDVNGSSDLLLCQVPNTGRQTWTFSSHQTRNQNQGKLISSSRSTTETEVAAHRGADQQASRALGRCF